MKKKILVVLMTCMLVSICACSSEKEEDKKGTEINNAQTAAGLNELKEAKFEFTSDITEVTGYAYNTETSGEGIVYTEGKLSITKGGCYIVGGNYADAQIVISVTKNDKVQLVLAGINITCSQSSPIYATCSDKLVITLADDTSNIVSDGELYVADADGEIPNGCIYSADDMTLNGNGQLTVNANYYHGISSKNDIKISSGTYVINAVQNGVRGKDSVEIKNCKLTVEAGNDGIKSNNEEEAGRGYVLIESGTVSIDSLDDGIQAVTSVTILKEAKVSVTAKNEAVKCEVQNIEEGSMTIK